MPTVLSRKPGGSGGGGAPSGPAGGDLAGTYPNPTIAPNSVAAAEIDGTDAAAIRTELSVPSNTEAILDTIVDAKGDLIAGTAADTVARRAVGTDGFALVADSGQATGLNWATMGIWANYTPTLGSSGTPPNIGSTGTATGRWTSVGKLAIVNAKFTFAGSGISAGTGNYQPSLPFTVGANQMTIIGGSGMFEDSSLADAFSFIFYGIAGQTYCQGYASFTTTTGLLGAAYPVVPATGDTIAVCCIAEMA